MGLFVAAYLAIALVLAGVEANFEFLFYALTTGLIAVGLLLLHRKVGFTTPLLVLLAIWGLVHMAGGLVDVPVAWTHGDTQSLYSMWLIPRDTSGGGPGGYLKYDQLVHAYGFGVSAWACWQALSHTTPIKQPTPGVLLLCALAACGLGAANEIIEFAVTLTTDNNVGGYVNTALDLVANAVGATIAVLAIYRFTPRPESG